MFRLDYGLPVVSATLIFRGQPVTLDNVIVDSGSAGTVFAADAVYEIGLVAERDDIIRRLHGIGGTETVFSKRLDSLEIGEFRLNDFMIEVAAMEYGFPINGIVGTGFLLQTRAVLDFANMTMTVAP